MIPLTDLPQILIGELGRITVMFLVTFKNCNSSGFDVNEKALIFRENWVFKLHKTVV